MTGNIKPASGKAYQEAAAILRDGGLVALPTETVYGLAASALDDKAVRHIYAVKGRPSHNPLICHVLSPEHVHDYAEVPKLAQDLIDAFFPGPLTLVLERKDTPFSDTATSGLKTIAIRCPDTEWRSVFLDAGFRGPIVMPSANRSGHVSPTSAKHVETDLGHNVELIIDAGDCPGGIESTIVKVEHSSATLLRPGIITETGLAPFVATLKHASSNSKAVAPGMLKSHYAPKAKVRLNAQNKKAHETYLGFGPTLVQADFNLSPTGDLSEAASKLYAALRKLDTKEGIAIAPIPTHGIGLAINDRLARAAAERHEE